VEQGSKDVAPSDTTAPVFLVDGDANDTAADSANTIRM
jgi:hypothetical protein